MFHKRTLFFPKHVSIERARVSRYLSILRRDIQEFVAKSSYRTLAELQTNSRRREIELEIQTREEREHHGKERRPIQSQSATKRAKPADSRAGGYKGRTCGKCGKSHEEFCRSWICYKCGKEGYMVRDCPKGFLVFFHCNQTGHRNTECPQLTQGPAHASSPAALHVTDGRPGKAETSRARGRSFQQTAEKVLAAPDVVVGTFLVSYVPTLVLLESGASRSFISLTFSRHISVRRKALSRPLRVSIADEHAVFSIDVFWGCVLVIFGVELVIDWCL
ncbi:uncharacterized protein LOC111920019 [Lactuca sativa]|uniref:uncharacterized protein LOC111920019 n=1 Tax=Lactuca sativa TaxID=4236 RepID=UPI000CD9B259|nr:uncharacterized protein LOC111920019 [Lactuca sativa]